MLLSTTVFLVDCGAYDRMLEASLFSSVTPIPSRAPSHSSITPMHSISHAVPSLMAHPPLSPYVSSKQFHSFAINKSFVFSFLVNSNAAVHRLERV